MDLNTIFTQIRDKLDAHYDRRERLIKISRDITALSKKMIFSLHRIQLQGDISSLPAGIQKEVDQREAEIQQLLEKAKPDIQGANAYRYNRQISPGIQEYIEALTFRHYIQRKSVPAASELQKSYFPTFPLSHEDYILGLADLTGELMRRAINNISSRPGHALALEICTTLHLLQSSFQGIYIPSSKAMTRGFAGDLQSKIDVMKVSVSKVETACYSVHVRGKERPDGWRAEVSDERPKRERENEDEFGRGKRQNMGYD